MDSWIPREIVPEIFSGERVIQLGPEGFTFHQHGSNQRLKFFLLPSPAIWHNELLLSFPGERDNKRTKYLLRTLTPITNQPLTTSDNGWCILLEDERFDSRGARFVINRTDGNKLFLHFDCPLQVSECNRKSSATTEQLLSNKCIAHVADLQQEFVIEKSSTDQFLSMSRPQNPTQYSSRLRGISDMLNYGLSSLASYFIKRYLDDPLLKNPIFVIASFLFYIQQNRWIDETVHAFVHHAWVETYQPTWNSTGRWKWFWKLWNYESPIPSKQIAQYLCHYIFFRSVCTNDYYRLLIISLHHNRYFPSSELASMYVIGYGWKILSALL